MFGHLPLEVGSLITSFHGGQVYVRSEMMSAIYWVKLDNYERYVEQALPLLLHGRGTLHVVDSELYSWTISIFPCE